MVDVVQVLKLLPQCKSVFHPNSCWQISFFQEPIWGSITQPKKLPKFFSGKSSRKFSLKLSNYSLFDFSLPSRIKMHRFEIWTNDNFLKKRTKLSKSDLIKSVKVFLLLFFFRLQRRLLAAQRLKTNPFFIRMKKTFDMRALKYLIKCFLYIIQAEFSH